jgi:hypothetical protein
MVDPLQYVSLTTVVTSTRKHPFRISHIVAWELAAMQDRAALLCYRMLVRYESEESGRLGLVIIA